MPAASLRRKPDALTCDEAASAAPPPRSPDALARAALSCLAVQGRLIEIAATGRREVSFDLVDFYHNESRLFGVDTLKRDLTASADVLDKLTPGFVAGDYRAARIAETCGLGEAQEAYRKVAGAAGRIVLRPQE